MRWLKATELLEYVIALIYGDMESNTDILTESKLMVINEKTTKNETIRTQGCAYEPS